MPGKGGQHRVAITPLLYNLTDQRTVIGGLMAWLGIKCPNAGTGAHHQRHQRQLAAAPLLPALINRSGDQQQKVGEDKEQQPFAPIGEKREAQVD